MDSAENAVVTIMASAKVAPQQRNDAPKMIEVKIDAPQVSPFRTGMECLDGYVISLAELSNIHNEMLKNNPDVGYYLSYYVWQGDSPDVEFSIKAYRYETPEEVNARQERDRKQRADYLRRQAERERQEYERLKEKFGGEA